MEEPIRSGKPSSRAPWPIFDVRRWRASPVGPTQGMDDERHDAEADEADGDDEDVGEFLLVRHEGWWQEGEL